MTRTVPQIRRNLVPNPSAELGLWPGWSQFPLVTNLGLGVAPDGAFVLEDNALTQTRTNDDLIPIDPTFGAYLESTLRWSSGTTQPRHYFGLQLFDKNKQIIFTENVNGFQNTETTIASPVNPTDTTITLTSAANWVAGANRRLAWDIQNDGSDFPNRNLVAPDIQSIASNVLTFTGQVGVTLAAGTKVRHHFTNIGSYFYTGAINLLTPASFTAYPSTIGPEQAAYETPTYTKFWRGTRYVKILWLTNRSTSGAAASTQIDNVKFYSLSPSAAIDTGIEYCHLIEMQFASGTVRLTTAAQDISWNGQTWEAVGGLLELGGIEETADGKGQGLDLKLAGVDQTVLAILLGSQYRGRTIQIWRAYLDQVMGTILDTPMLLFKGLQLNPYTVEESRTRDEGTVTISTRVAGYFGIERVRGIMSNLVSHQHHFTGDTFFKHSASLANIKIYWGTPLPRTPGSSTGGGRRRGGSEPQ